MRVRVICREDQRSWILGKIAENLAAELAPHAQVSTGPGSDPGSDVNHYVWYDDYDPCDPAPATIAITHIDSSEKLLLLRRQMTSAMAGIAMSRDSMIRLAKAGLPGDKLCFVRPAHDAAIEPRPIHVGITTRLYGDGCKREWSLTRLARSIDPRSFRFSIMGYGWWRIVAELRKLGFAVDYHDDFDRDAYRDLVASLDYYLYFGWDEGSMGYLDALHAGVKTIVTRQGFHLDFAGGPTHAFASQRELREIFARLEAERRAPRAAMSAYGWSVYAQKHLEIWRHLLGGGASRAARSRDDGLGSLLEAKPDGGAAAGARAVVSLAWEGRTRPLRADLARLDLRVRRWLRRTLPGAGISS